MDFSSPIPDAWSLSLTTSSRGHGSTVGHTPCTTREEPAKELGSTNTDPQRDVPKNKEIAPSKNTNPRKQPIDVSVCMISSIWSGSCLLQGGDVLVISGQGSFEPSLPVHHEQNLSGYLWKGARAQSYFFEILMIADRFVTLPSTGECQPKSSYMSPWLAAGGVWLL